MTGRKFFWVTSFLAATFSFGSAQAQFSDVVRSIDRKDYTFIDYSYNNALSNLGHNHSTLGRLFVPSNYDPSKTYKMMMFLHGDGEAGNIAGYNNTAQINQNIDNLIVNAEVHDYLLYVPQAPHTNWEFDQLTMANTAFAKAVVEYNVDPNQIYATGLSKGGNGLHRLMSNPLFNQGIAAYVPLSTSNSTMDPTQAAGLPAWYFAGRQDGFLQLSRTAVSTLAAANGGSAPVYPQAGDPDFFFTDGTIRYTEYQFGGHDNSVWNNGAYADQAMYEWLSTQSSDFGVLKQGDQIGISFSGTQIFAVEDTEGNIWNQISRYGAHATEDFALGFAHTLDGEMTTVSFEVTEAFQRVDPSASGMITALEDEAMAAYGWLTSYDGAAEITLHGLVPGDEYDLEIFASTEMDNVIGLYSVGDISKVMEATGNLDEWIVFEDVVADEQGRLVLAVAATNGSPRAAVTNLILTAVPEPSSMVLVVVGSLVMLQRQRKVAC